MSEEKKFEGDPLAWVPKSISDEIPQEVFDARMALLSDSDAEKLKSDFENRNDPVFRYIYFGGDMFGDLGANSSSTMTRCAYVGVDKETTLRLFRASAYGPRTDEKYVPALLEEAMEFVGEFREEMSMMGRGIKPRYLTRGGKDR